MTKLSYLRLAAAILVLIAFFASAVIFARIEAREELVALLVRVRELGWIGTAFAGALYVPACVFAIPGSILTLAMGFVFGPLKGTIAASLGSTTGATAAYFLGRTIGRNWIRQRIGENPRFVALDQAVGSQGFKIVFLTRLSPVFPFNVLNYAYGLTNVRPRDYLLGSWLGMLPGTFLYVYLGSALASVADLVAGRIEPSPWQQAAYVLGLVATLAVTILLARMARRALAATP